MGEIDEVKVLRENMRKMLDALEPFVNFGNNNRRLVFPIGDGCTAEISFSQTPSKAAIGSLVATLRGLQDVFPDSTEEVLTTTKLKAVVERIFDGAEESLARAQGKG